jgi:hypothetical protein
LYHPCYILGASTANPQDASLLTNCLNSINDEYEAELSVLISKLKSTQLAELPQDRFDSLKPVLEASLSKYCSERKNNIDHDIASESAMIAGRTVFSSARKRLPSLSPTLSQSNEDMGQSCSGHKSTEENISPGNNNNNYNNNKLSSADEDNNNSSSAVITRDLAAECRPLAASAPTPMMTTTPDGIAITDEDRKQWRAPKARASKGRRRHKPNPTPPAKLLLFGICSQYEEAEIGGGTTYTTEISLFEDGTVELGNHDIGQRGRQVRRDI